MWGAICRTMTNSGAPSAGIVVAGHGSFAAGLRDAVECVGGPQPRLATLSNHGLDADGIATALVEAVDRVRANVIFTDLPAGSCTIAARRLAKARGTITVVTGANLPMVLDFLLTERDGALGATLSAEKGRDAVLVFAAEPAPVTEDGSHGG